GRGGVDAGGDQAFGELGGDAEGLHQQLDRLRAGIDGLDTVFLDVDAPADETRGEARVLPLAPDGDGKILAGNHQQDPAVFLIENDLARHGRLEGLEDHLLGVGKVVDDVDLLAMELAHDGFDTCAAGADAGADGGNLRVGPGHGDLGAMAGLAGEGLDLDGAVGDFGDLDLEEAADKLLTGAAEDELGAAGSALDGEQDAADAVAGLVFLAGRLLLAGENGFGLAEVDEDIVALLTAHGAGDDVADHVLEVVVNAVLLELTQLLHHGLTRGLRGDAAEGGGVDFLFHDRAELSGGINGLRLLDVDLRLGVADRIDHLEQTPGMELTVLGVDLDLQLLPGANSLLGSCFDGINNRGDHVGAAHALLLFHVFKDGKNCAAHIKVWDGREKKSGPEAHLGKVNVMSESDSKRPPQFDVKSRTGACLTPAPPIVQAASRSALGTFRAPPADPGRR